MRSLIEDVRDGVRLPSYRFSLCEHCSRQGDSPVDLWDFEGLVPINGWKYVGWCPSASTCIPRSSWGVDCPIAVLLENGVGEFVWCHVSATPALIGAAFRSYGF